MIGLHRIDRVAPLSYRLVLERAKKRRGANLEEHLVTLGQRVGVGAIGAVSAPAGA